MNQYFVCFWKKSFLLLEVFALLPNICNLISIPSQAENLLTFKRRIKSRLPFAGIIMSSPYSTRFQDKG